MKSKTTRFRSKNRFEYRQVREAGEAPTNKEEKVRALAAEGETESIVRVSTEGQLNSGSTVSQSRRQDRYLHNIGVDPKNVRKTEFAESAKGDKERIVFQQVLNRIRTCVSRILVAQYGNRLTRNMGDGVRLLDTAAECGAMFVVGEQPRDPRDPDDRAFLLNQFVEAERENSQRAIHSADAREELARALAHRRILPVGYYWVPEVDPLYAAMARNAGIPGEPLSADSLAQHKTRVKKSGTRWFVLFDPHEDVHRALFLICRWLKETGHAGAVADRIANDPEYPRPGMVPQKSGNVFNAGIPTQWQPLSPHWLRAWLTSEAIYGVYSYCSIAGMQSYGKRGIEVYEPEAFPGYLHLRDEEAINDALSAISRPWGYGKYDGPRNHAIPIIRCAERVDSGRLCGRTFGAFYDPNGRYEYKCGECKVLRRKNAGAPPKLDDLVLILIKELFHPDPLDEIETDVDMDLSDHLRRQDSLTKRKLELEEKIGNGMDIQAGARGEDKQRTIDRWQERIDEYHRQIASCDVELQGLALEIRKLRSVSGSSLVRVKQLAGNIPVLLNEARRAQLEGRSEGAVRSIVGALIHCVHVRAAAAGLYEVEVEFPSGERVRALYNTQPPQVTLNERIYIADRLSRNHTPTEIAGELSHCRKIMHSEYRGRGRVDADRVIAIQCMHPAALEGDRKGRPSSTKKVAQIALESEEVVKAAILDGRLGPMRVGSTGDLLTWPTAGEIENAFPSTSPARMARAQGWAIGDVVLLSDLIVDLGLGRTVIEKVARRAGAIAKLPGKGKSAGSIVNLSMVGSALQELVVDPRLHVPAELSYLDDQQWFTHAQMTRDFPKFVLPIIREEAPSFTCRRVRYYWVNADRVQQILEGDLRKELRSAGFDHLPISEFMRQDELLKFLSSRYGVASDGSLGTANKKGNLVRITAKRGRQPLVCYWVPPEIRESSDPSVVWKWFAGDYRPPISSEGDHN